MMETLEILEMAKKYGITSYGETQIQFDRPSRLCIEDFARACYEKGKADSSEDIKQ